MSRSIHKVVLLSLVGWVLIGLTLFVLTPMARADDVVVTPLAEEGQYYSIKWTWQATAGGTNYMTGMSKYVTGYIIGVEFQGGTTATPAYPPTPLYDVTLVNSFGMDLLFGVGANLPTGVTDYALRRQPLTNDGTYPFLLNELVYPKVDNAGATKWGTFTIRLQR